MSHNNNPYSKAAGAYNTTTSTTTDQRTLEVQALLKAAQKLEDMEKRLHAGEAISLEETDATLTHNRKLWELFLDNMNNPEHLLPQEIKNNVASLAAFIFKRTLETLADVTPDKFKVLIDINRNIAAGLVRRPAVQQIPTNGRKTATPPAERMATDSVA